MALQIANATVCEKVALLAQKSGLSKTGADELAVQTLLTRHDTHGGTWREQMTALFAQMDKLPLLEDVQELEWDEQGLPK